MSRLQAFDAYLTGEMTEAEADALEQAMFDAPDDEDLAFLDRFARHATKLAEHGTYDIGVRRAHIDALIAAGHTVYVSDAGPPGRNTVSLDLSAELVVTRLQLGRTDLERVDVELTVIEHDVTKTIRDVLVDRDGSIYALCERPLAALAFGAGRTVARVRRCDGARDVIAEWDLAPQTF